jgi:hypothetical protein
MSNVINIPNTNAAVHAVRVVVVVDVVGDRSKRMETKPHSVHAVSLVLCWLRSLRWLSMWLVPVVLRVVVVMFGVRQSVAASASASASASSITQQQRQPLLSVLSHFVRMPLVDHVVPKSWNDGKLRGLSSSSNKGCVSPMIMMNVFCSECLLLCIRYLYYHPHHVVVGKRRVLILATSSASTIER